MSDADASGISLGIGMHWFSFTMVSCTKAPMFANYIEVVLLLGMAV